MQDNLIPIHGPMLNEDTDVTIPVSVVDWLRRATYAEIGSAAEALDTAVFAGDREAHPEWFRGPAESLRESYALLDAIGWSRTDPPLPARVDLRRSGWTLVRVLTSAVELADEELYEMAREQDAWADPGLVSECARVSELDEFTGMVQARIDELAVTEGATGVLDLAA